MYPDNLEGDPSNRWLIEQGKYISDTARNRTHNLFRPKQEPIPLRHSDGLFSTLKDWLDPVVEQWHVKQVKVDLDRGGGGGSANNN